jgi:GntR family transcriptional regulator, transcriptional repressor for pyruvate dehydrogenase complex
MSSGLMTRPVARRPSQESPRKLGLTAVRKTRVYEGVARQLQRLIEEGVLKPGDMLPPEREMVERFGVSRSSVRDAIRTLELVGMVEARQGEGTVVAEAKAEALVVPLAGILLRKREMVGELLEVRRMIEPPLAARAARHATADQVSRLEEILGRQEERTRRGEPSIEEDTEFHYTIALAAGNSVVQRVVDVLMDLLRESRVRSLQVRGRPEKSLGGHRRILRAIRKRDPAMAEKAMRSHLSEIERVVLKKL